MTTLKRMPIGAVTAVAIALLLAAICLIGMPAQARANGPAMLTAANATDYPDDGYRASETKEGTPYGSYHFEGEEIVIGGVLSGSASYDYETCTLTITNLNAEYLIISKNEITVKMIGTNSFDAKGDSMDAKNLILEGPGTLQAPLYCEDLEIRGASIKGDLFCSNFTMQDGTVKLKGHEINIDGNFTMNGGTVVGNVECSGAVGVHGGAITGGIIALPDAKGDGVISGGHIGGNVEFAGSGTITGGTIEGVVDADGPLVMSGGSIGNVFTKSFTLQKGTVNEMDLVEGTCTILGGTVRLRNACIYGNFTMKGGKIVVDNPNKIDYAIDVYGNFNMSGGSISISKTGKSGKPTWFASGGISIEGGNFNMTGGAITVLNSISEPIKATSKKISGKKVGGMVKITGGSVTAVVAPSAVDRRGGAYAISADKMFAKPSCLKKIVGQLSNGATFQVGNNTFKSNRAGNSMDAYASLVRYGDSATNVMLSKVSYGKVTYTVDGIAAGAFNTIRGSKVKSLTFTSSLNVAEKECLAGAKNLVSLTMASNFYPYRSSNPKWVSPELKSSKAFAKAGKNGGKSLTVTITGTGRDDAAFTAKVKKLYVSKGLAKEAQVVCAR